MSMPAPTSSQRSDTPPVVSLIVPAYRQTTIRDCLESAFRLEGDGVAFDVHVVLNDAAPAVRAIVADFTDDRLVVHDPGANLGVGAAYNLAFAASRAAYMVGLQDDATVQPGLLRLLRSRLESAPDIAGAGALVTNGHGDVWDAGWVIWADGFATPAWHHGDRRPSTAQARTVAHHGTMGMMIRRTAWESIGGFDDSFYPVMYGDVDASIAMRRRGWRIVVEPRARASQRINSSITPPFAEFLLNRHRELLVEKHGSFLEQAPRHTTDATAVEAEFARIAATPEGPQPAPPSGGELALLRSRLAQTPESFLRRERDLLAAYRIHVEQRLAESAQALDLANEDLARREVQVRAATDDAERRAAAAEHHAATVAMHADETARALLDVTSSHSWRITSPLRHIARIMRGMHGRN